MHQGLQQAVGETFEGLVLLPQPPLERMQRTVWKQQQWQDVLSWPGGVGIGTGKKHMGKGDYKLSSSRGRGRKRASSSKEGCSCRTEAAEAAAEAIRGGSCGASNSNRREPGSFSRTCVQLGCARS